MINKKIATMKFIAAVVLLGLLGYALETDWWGQTLLKGVESLVIVGFIAWRVLAREQGK
jgi:hypothetical protein